MIDYSFKKGQLVLRVQVVPRASRSVVVGEHNGLLRVRIAAPPVDGAANKELVRLLARKFEVPRSAVTIVAGQSARTKQVRITDVKRDLEFVKAVLAGDKRG